MIALKRFATLMLATAMALTAPSSASAAEEVNVSLTTCSAAPDGEVTVPAGSRVVVEETWSDTTKGSVSRFLRLQQTTATLDGVPVGDLSSFWGPGTSVSGGWATTWTYNTGVTLSAGESLQVDFDIVLTKRLHTSDGTLYQPGSVFGGPISCRITASA